jgi:hypothetical protein
LKWIQRINPDGTSRFDEVGTSPRVSSGAFIGGDIESFVSPIDGSVISDRKQLREHNKKHNVVNAAEFTPEFYAGKAKERADFYEGRTSRAETQERKEAIYETMIRAENGHREFQPRGH